jgi:hypothetical protein
MIVFSPARKGSTKDLIVITSNDHKKPFKVKINSYVEVGTYTLPSLLRFPFPLGKG